MAKLYSNENFPFPVVEILRTLGHDVLTTYESGLADKRTSDDDIIRFATAENRIIITINRWCFVKRHNKNPMHSGIIVCSLENDISALANRIDSALSEHAEMNGMLLRIDRPSK
jgi:uncharacterized protein with PIN domain